jgi:hypothetical protein
VIFEHADYPFIGTRPDSTQNSNSNNNANANSNLQSAYVLRYYFCKPPVYDKSGCSREKEGQLIVQPGYSGKAASGIVHLTSSAPSSPSNNSTITFSVQSKGYYCVLITRTGLSDRFDNDPLDLTIVTINPFGHLRAGQYPLMRFTAIMSCVYAAFFVGWSFLCYAYRRELLAVQKLLLAVIATTFVELVVHYSYLSYINGSEYESNVLVVLMLLVLVPPFINYWSFLWDMGWCTQFYRNENPCIPLQLLTLYSPLPILLAV